MRTSLRQLAAATAAMGAAATLLIGATASSAATRMPAAQVAAKPPFVGVDLYVTQNYPLAEVKAWGQRDIKYIAQTLKLKAVAIAWDYNVPTKTSNQVVASQRTPSIADLNALTAIAHSYRLRVEYRVLFAINNSDNRSSSIVPANFKAWLSSLEKTEAPMLKLAQQDKVAEVIVGTEMARIDRNPLWGGFFTWAAQRYHGILSYATWGGRPGIGGFFGTAGWGIMPGISDLGASAYPSVKLPVSTSVARLTTAWVSFLQHEPPSVLKRTAIDEIGIPAVSGAYADPWNWTGLKGTADDQVQARWFDAACRAVGITHMRGIYFWSEDLNDNPAHPYPSLVKWMGRPAAETAIRTCAQQALAVAK